VDEIPKRAHSNESGRASSSRGAVWDRAFGSGALQASFLFNYWELLRPWMQSSGMWPFKWKSCPGLLLFGADFFVIRKKNDSNLFFNSMKVKALFLLVAVLVLKVQINLKEINRFTNCRHSAFTIDFRFFCLRYLLLVDFSGKHYVNHSPWNSFSNVYLFLWLNHCCFSTGCQSTKKARPRLQKRKSWKIVSL